MMKGFVGSRFHILLLLIGDDSLGDQVKKEPLKLNSNEEKAF